VTPVTPIPARRSRGHKVNQPRSRTKPKRKSYPLPPLDRPTEIPGFPLRAPAAGQDADGIVGPAKDIPAYGSIGQAIRAAEAERRGKRAPLTPIGPSELRKRGQ
jgi:hypothetical protein